MDIKGLQKLTLLDFPGHVACTVFLGGCNFACPFCHNTPLLKSPENFISEEEFFDFLKKRQGVLDGVAITGGEPLLRHEIVPFVAKIKELGYKVKVDTNGSYPDTLKELVNKNLVDYVAMDIKNTIEKYPITTLNSKDIPSVVESINFLLSDKVDYEFRTTVVKEFHNVEDFIGIGKLISGAKRYFIQSFEDHDSVADRTLHALEKDELEKCLKEVSIYVKEASIRGVN